MIPNSDNIIDEEIKIHVIFTVLPVPTGNQWPDPSAKDKNLFSPLSVTLIYTSTTALLIDCPASAAATGDLASWVESELPSGCTLKYFITTHAHGDHFFGYSVPPERFRGIKAVATKHATEAARAQYEPQLYEGMWKTVFPSNIASTKMPVAPVEFEALTLSNELDLDGHLLKVHDVPHGDICANSFIHIPELGLVVAGDIIYNGDCHQHLREACTQEKRDQWRAGLKQIAGVNLKIIVPGYTFTPSCEADEAVAKGMLRSTEEYILGFEEELAKATSADELFKTLRSRYNRLNLAILSGSCRGSFEAKIQS